MQSHDKGRGYRVGENQFLPMRDDELEEAERESRRRPYSAPPSDATVEDDEQVKPPKILAPARPFSAAPVKRQTPDPISSVPDTPLPTPRISIP